MEAEINLARLKTNMAALSKFGSRKGGGITRASFGEADRQAKAWLVDRMKKAGLHSRVDEAGNVWGRLGGKGPSVVAGSHIDTVPEGGMFDGALGVLGALECLQTVGDNGMQHVHPMEMVIFSDEEGAFFSFLGSRACMGLVDPKELTQAANVNGYPLSAALAESGLELEHIARAQRSNDDVRAYLELHIEQGPQLEYEGVPIGIVESIVGIVNYWIIFTGQAGHAGTTPLTLRRDAFLGAAEFALQVDKLVRSSGQGVVTVGDMKISPGAFNIVPQEARLALEFRSAFTDHLKKLEQEIIDLGREVAKKRNLTFTHKLVSWDEPVQLSNRIRHIIQMEADTLGYSWRPMDSGAGHDAQILAHKTQVGMIFIPSIGGCSHCPEENSRWPDVAKGTQLLLRSLLKLSNEEYDKG